MHKLGTFLVLHGLLIGIQSLPSKLHHVKGRTGAQISSLDLQNYDLESSKHVLHREPRRTHMLRLHDPLDCLSQVVCGMNTYPPQKPSVRTSTANDFAYLLKNSVAKLRSQKTATTTTTTTVAPATKRTSTTKAPVDDDDEDDYDDDDDLDYEGDNIEEDYDDQKRSGKRRTRRRSSIFSKRRGEASKSKKTSKSNKGKSTFKKANGKNNHPFKKFLPNQPRPLTPLDRLRMETNLRAKLLSDAQCINGLIDHSCPFNYQQMLVLISSALERERTISYTSTKVLPMVGYLIKSRNYTGTLQATFSAIEKINNYTIEADRDGKPIDFTHILDEVMNRQTGDAGLRIVDTSNDSASASVWEDDEFDHVLQNPYERRRPQSDNYKLAEKKKQKLKEKQQQLKKKKKVPDSDQAAEDDQSTTSEEDTSEEGLVFDRSRPPPRGPPNGDGESSSEEDEVNHEDNAEVVKEKKPKKKTTGTGFGKQSSAPGPVFGFSHLQKSAEDE